MKKKRIISILVVFVAFVSLVGYKYFTRITICDYKKISLQKKESAVTKEELNEKIDEIMKKYAKTVHRKSKSKDIICFSRSAKQDEKEVKEFHSSYEEIKVGDNSFLTGFDKHLIGLRKGDHKKFAFTFPKNYKNKKYAGQTYVFHVTVKDVKEIPKCTDQFVQEKLFYKNLKEMKQKLRLEIVKKKKAELKTVYKEQAWKKVMEGSIIRKYPKVMLTNARKQLETYYKSLCKSQQLSWNGFLKQYFGDKEHYENTIRKAAQTQTKEKLIIEKICEKEHITLSEKEYSTKAKALARKYGYEDLENFEKNNSKSTIKMVLLKEEVLKVIMENVNYTRE